MWSAAWCPILKEIAQTRIISTLASHCSKSRVCLNFLCGQPCIVSLEPPGVGTLRCCWTGSIQMHESDASVHAGAKVSLIAAFRLRSHSHFSSESRIIFVHALHTKTQIARPSACTDHEHVGVKKEADSLQLVWWINCLLGRKKLLPTRNNKGENYFLGLTNTNESHVERGWLSSFPNVSVFARPYKCSRNETHSFGCSSGKV